MLVTSGADGKIKVIIMFRCVCEYEYAWVAWFVVLTSDKTATLIEYKRIQLLA